MSMIERQLPDRDPGLAPDPGPDNVPEITTPVINIQDVEYDAREETRVNNSGVPVKDKRDDADLESEKDEQARKSEQKFDEALTRIPPG